MSYKWAIFDLDNCLANDQWRIQYIDWTQSAPDHRYHDYHSLAPFDSPANLDTFRPLARASKIRIAFFTARPAAFRAATGIWLDRNGMRFDALMMRPRGDHRPSMQLKAAHLLSFLKDNSLSPQDDIIGAFDDRQDVVEMYLRQGVGRAAQLSIHDVCAYTPPAGAAPLILL